MVQNDLGAATIVYEGPDGEPVELTAENEHVAYFQDHWVVKLDEEERTPGESGADASGSGHGSTDESEGQAAGDTEAGAGSDGAGAGANGRETSPEETAVEPDTIRRIPAARVYHVERDVETFEEEVGTRLDDVQSVAESLERELQSMRSRVESVAGGVQTGLFGRGEPPADEVQRIEVETGGEDGEESGDGAGEQERPAS